MEMNRFAIASLVAPLAVPLIFAILGGLSGISFGIALVVFLFPAGATWFVGVPMNLFLARKGRERWWISVVGGFALGVVAVLWLAGLPENNPIYVLSVYGLSGLITAGIFHAIWKSKIRKGEANQRPQVAIAHLVGSPKNKSRA